MSRRLFTRRAVVVGAAATALPRPAAAGGPSLAVIPRRTYYDEATLRRWGAWGPPARRLPAPAGLSSDPGEHARRVVAAARSHIGLPYQHHHVPDFAPPAGWPWLEVSAGRNGPGLDCSNFTSLAFNQGLGVKLPTGIASQAEATDVPGPGGRGVARLDRIAFASHSEAIASLRPADLLFIRSDAGRVSHVVLWLGEIRGVPSFVDCTDSPRRSAGGEPIPTGVHVRPFLAGNWYGRNFAHALRLNSLGAGAAPEVGEGGDV